MNLFSIIIPVYNIGKIKLSRLLNSLITSQKKINVEYQIIFVNDASPNKEDKDFLDKINFKNIKIIHNEINYGLSMTRQIGVDNSNGEWILHIDADDYVLENYFELVTRWVSKYKDKDFIQFNCIYEIGNTRSILNNLISSEVIFFNGKHEYFKNIEGKIQSNQWMCATWSLIIKRDFLNNNNINFLNKNVTCEDLYYYLILINYSNNWVLINQAPYIYTNNLDGITKSTNYSKLSIDQLLNYYYSSMYLTSKNKKIYYKFLFLRNFPVKPLRISEIINFKKFISNKVILDEMQWTKKEIYIIDLKYIFIMYLKKIKKLFIN